MNRDVRVKVDMGDRVIVFNAAHPPTTADGKAVFDQLETEVTRVKALAALQLSGQAAARGAVAFKKELRSGLQKGLLRFLVRLGEGAVAEIPELAHRFVLPKIHASHQTFMTAVNTMLADVNTHRDAFRRLGLTDQLLVELTGLFGQYTKAIEQRAASRQQHVGASADIEASANRIVEIVERINGLTQHRFRREREVLAAWDSARTVVTPGGKPTGDATANPPAPSGPGAEGGSKQIA